MDRTVSPKCSTSTRFDYKTPRKPPLASWEGSPYLPSFFPQLASVWPFLRSFGLEFGRPTQPQMEAQVEHKKHITCVTTLETTWRVEENLKKNRWKTQLQRLSWNRSWKRCPLHIMSILLPIGLNFQYIRLTAKNKADFWNHSWLLRRMWCFL